MHLELTSSKWVHCSYVLEVILTISPNIYYGVLCVKRGSHPLCSAIRIILLPYEYSQRSSAHSQHYRTSKACEIDDLVNNNMYYCTYLYALRQPRKK